MPKYRSAENKPLLGMIDDPNSQVAVACFSMVLSDEPWRDIGFSKRPRYGAFFQQFRARWKTDLEKRTLQEMLAAFTAAYVVAGRVSSDKVLSIVGAYTARADLLTALGYSSREEGMRDLTETVAGYCSTPIRDWAGIVAKGIQPTSILDKVLSARLSVGCVRFSQNLGEMVLLLRRPGPNGT